MVVDFSVEFDSSQNLPILNIKGEIDIHTCPKLQDSLKEFTKNNDSNIVLNLQDIHYIDSTGLGTIAYTAKEMDKNENKVIVVCDKPQIKKIFEVSGLLSKNIKLLDNISQVTQGQQE
jgi:anti-anti-sigma factor